MMAVCEVDEELDASNIWTEITGTDIRGESNLKSQE
jgi:hypothetical protein